MTCGIWLKMSRRSFVMALVLLLVAGAYPVRAAAQLGNPSTQAVVYNGSNAASSVYLVAFTDAGFLIEVASDLFPLCVPADPSDGPRRIQPVTERAVGVYRAGLGIHGVDPAGWPQSTGHWPPFTPPSVGDDCDALDQINAVQEYLAHVSSTADSRRSATASCVAEVAQLACQLKLVASAVSTVPPTGDPYPCALLLPILPLAPTTGQICEECAHALIVIPGLLNQLAAKRAECEFIRDDLAALLDVLVDAQASATAVREDLRDCALILGPHDVDYAHQVLDHADQLLIDLAASKDECAVEQLEASCPCDLVPPGSTRTSETSTANRDRDAAIDRLARAFAAAARQSLDRDERVHLAMLARRLDRLPARRVAHVGVPSDSQLTQDLVAVRSACAVDDGHEPLAVVLTLMPAGRERPPVGPAEQRRLFDAFKLFAQTLAAERPCPSGASR